MHKKRSFLLLIMAGSIVTACADIKDTLNLHANVPAAWQEAVPSDAQPATLNGQWWRSAEDEDLNKLVSVVERQNLSLEQARYRLVAARAGTGGKEYLPTLNASASSQFDKTLNDQPSALLPGTAPSGANGTNFGTSRNKMTGYYRAGFDASWEVPLFGQYAAARDKTKAEKDFAEADVKAVRATVIAEAITAYVELRAAQNTLTDLEAVRDAQEKIVELYRIKADAGLSARTDEYKEIQEVQRTVSEIETVRNRILEKKYTLAQLTGTSIVAPEWQETKKIPVFKEIAVADTPLDVVRNRPDIRKAEQSVLIEASNLNLAKSDLWPKLTLGGNLSQIGNITGDPLPGNIVQVSAFPNISLPLFDWGVRRAKVDAQNAKLGETASQYRESVVTALTEVEQAMGRYGNESAQSDHALKVLSNAKKVAEHGEILRKEGLSDAIDPLNARIVMLRAKSDRNDALAAQGTALASMAKALGGGLEIKEKADERTTQK